MSPGSQQPPGGDRRASGGGGEHSAGLGAAPEGPGQEPKGERPCEGLATGQKGCALRSGRVPACWGVEGGAWQERSGEGWRPTPCPTGPILKGEAQGETEPPKALTVSGPPAPGAGVDEKGA